MLVTHYVSCSWCYHVNPRDVTWCRRCGHAAQLPRVACRCASCLSWLALAELARAADQARGGGA